MPPEPPDGFVEVLRPGSQAELSFQGGWWEVSLLKRTPAGKFQVIADRYDAKHSVAEERIRPAWSWRSGATKWKEREKGEKGVADAK